MLLFSRAALVEHGIFPNLQTKVGTPIANLVHTMSDNQFDNLLQKYCNELETQKSQEYLSAKRARIFARIRKFILLLMLCGAGYSAYHFRGELKAQYNKMFPPKAVDKGDPNDPINKLEVGGASKSKLKEVRDNTLKREKELEDTFNNVPAGKAK